MMIIDVLLDVRDANHLFVNCVIYQKWRESARDALLVEMDKKLSLLLRGDNEESIKNMIEPGIRAILAKSLFVDDSSFR